jgi:glutaredoxin 2
MNIYMDKPTEEFVLREATAKKISKSEVIRKAIELYSAAEKGKEIEDPIEKLREEFTKLITRGNDELNKKIESQVDRLAKLVYKTGMLAGQILFEHRFHLERTLLLNESIKEWDRLPESKKKINEGACQELGDKGKKFGIDFMKVRFPEIALSEQKGKGAKE